MPRQKRKIGGDIGYDKYGNPYERQTNAVANTANQEALNLAFSIANPLSWTAPGMVADIITMAAGPQIQAQLASDAAKYGNYVDPSKWKDLISGKKERQYTPEEVAANIAAQLAADKKAKEGAAWRLAEYNKSIDERNRQLEQRGYTQKGTKSAYAPVSTVIAPSITHNQPIDNYNTLVQQYQSHNTAEEAQLAAELASTKSLLTTQGTYYTSLQKQNQQTLDAQKRLLQNLILQRQQMTPSVVVSTAKPKQLPQVIDQYGRIVK